MNNQITNEIKRGDIYLYDFGTNEDQIICGLMPVLVLQSDKLNKSPTVIVAAITSISIKQYHSSHILIGSRYGLKHDSIIMIEQIKAVKKGDLQKYIGYVDDEAIWHKINNAIKKVFGLWFYKNDRTGDIRCLCSKCLSDYKSNPSIIVKRLDPFSAKTDKCDKCDNLGYDYMIFDKKVTK